jgi:hypothetical protein
MASNPSDFLDRPGLDDACSMNQTQLKLPIVVAEPDPGLVNELLDRRLFENVAIEALTWIQQLASDNATASGLRYTIAINVLEGEASRDDSFATFATERESASRLETELARRLEEMLRYFSHDPKLAHVFSITKVEFARIVDYELVKLVESMGKAGNTLARIIRSKLQDKVVERDRSEEQEHADDIDSCTLKSWLPEKFDVNGSEPFAGPTRIRDLARVLWRDIIGPQIELAKTKRPALVRDAHELMVDLLNRNASFNTTKRTIISNGRDIARVPVRSEPVKQALYDSCIINGVSLLGTIHAHQLFHYLAFAAHDRHLMGLPLANILEFQGGWTRLCEVNNWNPDRYIPRAKSIVHVFAYASHKFPDGSEGNLIQFSDRSAEGGRQANLVITVGHPMLPGYVHGIRGSERRKLRPLLRCPIPLMGRANEHGAIMTCSYGVIGLLRDHAIDLCRYESARIQKEDWLRIAERAGFPTNKMSKLVEHWLRGDSRAPPFLQKVKDNRYTLSDAHADERKFLIAAGKDELLGSNGGRRGQLKKHMTHAMTKINR